MIRHIEISDAALREQIKSGDVCLGGNSKLNIYGTLTCSSGKRMKRVNRVFFVSAQEAQDASYRPCGNCMKEEYKKWTYSHTP